MTAPPRERMIQSAALLMRERGVEATSFSDVLEHSRAPRGSIYHHFPGGKAQLVEEATRFAGDFVAAGLAAALADDDPVRAVRLFADTWLGILRDSDFAAGCPVVAVAVEGDRTPGGRAAAGEAFERWQMVLADALAARDVDPERAAGLATLAVAAIEGAVVVSRAQRSTVPLERVCRELTTLVESVV